MNAAESHAEIGLGEEVPVPENSADAQPPAWELIDVGRYMPRRIRGSFRGRVLG